MLRLRRARGVSERGSAMVEAMLVLIVTLLVIFGAIQFSIVVFGYNSVAFAARAGTRYAIVNGSSSTSPCTAAQVQSVVLENLAGVPSAVVTVTTTWISNNNPGSTVKVVVSANFAPMVKWVMPNAITVASTSQMIILQ
jgi:Flp pilus assembly protein TadG